ncbi:hypothetical protein P691DRAFT_791970 [Macrolepiota fuliginosa MF-IS2]|uniref:Peptidase C19 ubiquitin carboxyl-terminal hydrolase domain-containing protein n=1 Tax=Macrolepiota fuliginosa MF-IS2 TaxID=1400762 RepID=A0A9P5XFZ4_9AGAR|nr:hypothetical protein P691DRAFT_791970 [Macrolepiota fuliginosa MF-IS2]
MCRALPLRWVLHPVPLSECVECQMYKVSDGLLSGWYSRPASVKYQQHSDGEAVDSSTLKFQEAVRLVGLKGVIGKGHAGFATMGRQDAEGFLMYLINTLRRDGHKSRQRREGVTVQDPRTIFSYGWEQRLQCIECKGVRYMVEEAGVVSISVPATEKGEAEGGKAIYEDIELWKSLDALPGVEVLGNGQRWGNVRPHVRFGPYPLGASPPPRPPPLLMLSLVNVERIRRTRFDSRSVNTSTGQLLPLKVTILNAEPIFLFGTSLQQQTHANKCPWAPPNPRWRCLFAMDWERGVNSASTPNRRAQVEVTLANVLPMFALSPATAIGSERTIGIAGNRIMTIRPGVVFHLVPGDQVHREGAGKYNSCGGGGISVSRGVDANAAVLARHAVPTWIEFSMFVLTPCHLPSEENKMGDITPIYHLFSLAQFTAIVKLDIINAPAASSFSSHIPHPVTTFSSTSHHSPAPLAFPLPELLQEA